MFAGLQIPRRRERWLVGVADLALSPLRWRRAAPHPAVPRRILLLRLERIGDLIMALPAIRQLRAALPEATIDLAVGSWNRDLAALISGLDRIETLDVPWLAREGTGQSWRSLVSAARTWRGRYDTIVNFEPDIRSNLLAWLSRAPRRVGYRTGGGGAFLTEAYAYDPHAHVSDNAQRLVAHLVGNRRGRAGDVARLPALQPTADVTARAAAMVASRRRHLIGVHVSGGRESKQWHLDRFASVAREVARRHDATIVLTGAADDRRMIDAVKAALSDDVHVIDVGGVLDLPALSGVLAALDVLVTSDTGPMHLAAAVGTPVVALFGPSEPRRYGPIGSGHQILRVDLPCSPCGLVRLPPERCRGHVPDCMDAITVDRVVGAVTTVLDARG
jgi:lipopolysaccharide heptosyltransferase II